jgi:hypothetical protein
MAFKRDILPSSFATGERLTADLVSIGFLFAANRAKEEPNIEDSIIAASIEGLKGDYRVLSLLVDWIHIHMKQVNIDRLVNVLKELPDKKLKAFWSSVAKSQKNDPRLKKLSRIYRGSPFSLLDEEDMKFRLKRDGMDPRFTGSHFVIPGKVLRHRPSDIADSATVARFHLAYRYRLIIGPTYRADMWAALELAHKLTPAEIARKCYGSFSTAWNVKRDWEIIHQLAA